MRGLHPAWVTFLLAFLTFSLATGLLVLYAHNLAVPLQPDGFSYLRLRLRPPEAPSPLLSSLVLLVTPVLAVEFVPLLLLPHVLGLSALLTLAVERSPGQRQVTWAAGAGLAFALATPMPGLYGYPMPAALAILLYPQGFIPIISFFADPLVRYTFPVLAYGLLALAIVLRRPWIPRPRAPRPLPRSLAYALPATLAIGMLLVILGPTLRLEDVGVVVNLKVIGLLVNWSLLPVALALWAFRYRPGVTRLRLEEGETTLQRVLTGWRNPAAAFVGFILVVLLVAGLPPVEAIVEASAPGHHLQHVVLFLAGLFQGGILYQQARAHRKAKGLLGEAARFVHVSNVLYNPRGLPGLLFAAAVLGLWHIPFFWDLALGDPLWHGVEHTFVIAAGSAVAFGLVRMGRGVQYLLLSLFTVVAGLLSLSLWFTPFPVYATYPLEELQALGQWHFLLGMPLTVFAVGGTLRALRNGPPNGPSEEAAP